MSRVDICAVFLAMAEVTFCVYDILALAGPSSLPVMPASSREMIRQWATVAGLKGGATLCGERRNVAQEELVAYPHLTSSHPIAAQARLLTNGRATPTEEQQHQHRRVLNWGCRLKIDVQAHGIPTKMITTPAMGEQPAGTDLPLKKRNPIPMMKGISESPKEFMR